MSFSSSGGKFESALLHVRDEKASGTGGGAGTTGSFQPRTLNTVMTNEISGASLASNQITLPSGTFFIMSQLPFRFTDEFRVKLRNTTDSSDTIIGTSEYVLGGASVKGFIIGRFTIASSKVFEIQYHIYSSQASSTTLGFPAGFGITEVYTDVLIWKVA